MTVGALQYEDAMMERCAKAQCGGQSLGDGVVRERGRLPAALNHALAQLYDVGAQAGGQSAGWVVGFERHVDVPECHYARLCCLRNS